MIDESRNAMIEYAMKEFQDNKTFSLLCLEDVVQPDAFKYQVANAKLIDGKFIQFSWGERREIYPLSALARIDFPSEEDLKRR